MAMSFKLALSVAALAGLAALTAPAAAQVYYRPLPPTSPGFPFYPYSDQSPYAQEFGVRPSYQIFPDAYGQGPVARAVPRCNYPNGWNVTDFDRDLNGIPAGINHQCPEPVRLRRHY